MNTSSGIVYLVGAGPGAPDLLTLRAARLLERADIVFYDALVHPDTIALAANARKIAVGKRCGKHSTAQQFINKRLVDAAARYAVVVRLKGGDPMLFGRAQEEIAALEAAGVRYEVVPGITAALAASAEIGISLTQRGVVRTVSLVTPRVGDGEAANEWARSVAAADASAIYMGIGRAEAIAGALIAAGKRRSYTGRSGRERVAAERSRALYDDRGVAGHRRCRPDRAGRYSGRGAISRRPRVDRKCDRRSRCTGRHFRSRPT